MNLGKVRGGEGAGIEGGEGAGVQQDEPDILLSLRPPAPITSTSTSTSAGTSTAAEGVEINHHYSKKAVIKYIF